MKIQAAFADSYARARVLFLEAAACAGLSLQSHQHPETGLHGETLALDVARDGPQEASRLLILSSACHGVEGHCGSGVQVSALHDAQWLAHARAAGVAVLYLHALNPHGFSYSRRVTQENVDLNRNFADFSAPLPPNPAYDDLHDRLLPDSATWPPGPDNAQTIAQWVAQHGLWAYQAAVSQGQYAHPDGLFFGGTAPTWSHRTLRRVLREHGQHARHIAWIDLHTGLGPLGLGERIWAGRDEATALARARRWWDGGGSTPITSMNDGTSTSAPLTGLMWEAFYQECPHAQHTGMALEYGTLPIEDILNALRADHWLHRAQQRGQAVEPALADRIRQHMREAFYVNTPEWRGQIVAQARQALFQAVAGLAQEGT
jgi:hypothetical protein